MRNRIVLLLLLASLLGTPVLVHRVNVAQRCANIADSALCAAVAPDPLWVRPFGLVSASLLVAVAILFAQAWSGRRREKVLLNAMGVPVREEELPLGD